MGISAATIAQYLKGQHFPAKKKDLIETARKNDAPEDVLSVLEEMPEDEFHGPNEVAKAYGDMRGPRVPAATIAQYLKGQHFPAEKKDLIETARKNEAPEDVLSVLEELPEDEFRGPNEVEKAYGEMA